MNRLDAYDTNDDGYVDMADAPYHLQYMFQGGESPPAPFAAPGYDATPNDPLTEGDGPFGGLWPLIPDVADVNDDGEITGADYLCLENCLLGQGPPPPAPFPFPGTDPTEDGLPE